MFTRPASRSSRSQLQVRSDGVHGRIGHHPARSSPHTSLVETESSPKNSARRTGHGPSTYDTAAAVSTPPVFTRAHHAAPDLPGHPPRTRPSGHTHPYVSARHARTRRPLCALASLFNVRRAMHGCGRATDSGKGRANPGAHSAIAPAPPPPRASGALGRGGRPGSRTGVCPIGDGPASATPPEAPRRGGRPRGAGRRMKPGPSPGGRSRACPARRIFCVSVRIRTPTRPPTSCPADASASATRSPPTSGRSGSGRTATRRRAGSAARRTHPGAGRVRPTSPLERAALDVGGGPVQVQGPPLPSDRPPTPP